MIDLAEGRNATTKDGLHRLVETLSEPAATEVLDDIWWLLEEPATPGLEEIERVRRGDEQIARGQYVTPDQLRRARNGEYPPI
jgi:hypothetical protein